MTPRVIEHEIESKTLFVLQREKKEVKNLKHLILSFLD